MDLTNPQSLNQYGYVMNGPLNRVDPSGLCDVVSGGITQTPGTAETAVQEAFATDIGANSAFPFSELNRPESLAVIGSPLARNVLRNAIVNAAQQTPTGQQVNLFLMSGSAQLLSDVWPTLPEDVQTRVGNITYISPGIAPGTNLLPGSNVILGHGAADGLVTSISSLEANSSVFNTIHVDCGHDANGEFQ
jgi:hypothetical protein